MFASPHFILTEYYDSIINKIDISAETRLIENDISDYERNNINQIRNQFIDVIRGLEKDRMEYYDKNPKECEEVVHKVRELNKQPDSILYIQPHKLVCEKFCIFIDRSHLGYLKLTSRHFSSSYDVGILIIIDYCFSENQIEKLKKFLNLYKKDYFMDEAAKEGILNEVSSQK
jgi:hypothetical protein